MSAAPAENPVEVRGDLHHRAAGVLRAYDYRTDYLRHYLWVHIASVIIRRLQCRIAMEKRVASPLFSLVPTLT